MKIRSRILIPVLVAAALVTGMGLLWFRGGSAESSDNGKKSRNATKTEIFGGKRGNSKSAHAVLTDGAKPKVKISKSGKVAQRHKPDFLKEVEEEAKFTDAIKKIFAELQSALDVEDKKKVYSLVRKLQQLDEWPDEIPRSVKLKALDALAWFGSDGFAEAVGFLADSDSEVVQTAIEKFEEMLSDIDMGDVQTSEILKQLTKVVHDRDALDSFFTEMNNMRDTVKAQTALSIYDSGNVDAISVLGENIEFIFSDADYEVKTREDVERFLKDAEQAYKDNPEKAQEDEDFYGPSKE